MSRISVRGIAVASATAVTAVGAVAGISNSGDPGQPTNVEGLGTSTSLAVLPIGHQVQQLSADVQQYAGAQQAQATAAAQRAQQQAAEQQRIAQQRAQAALQASRSATRTAVTPSTSSSSSDDSSSSSSSSSSEYGDPKTIAAEIVPASQFQCFSNIISRESGWNVHATNPSSGAYGLGQALPPSKMAAYGSDWRNNPTTQIKWAYAYMNSRYGSPCGAWSFWEAHSWY